MMKINKNKKWLLVVLCAWAFLSFQIGVSHQTAAAATIIDHTCTDLSKIPQAWIEQAKSNLRLSYGHTSHGSQLITGITAMRSTLYEFNTNGSVAAEVLSIHDSTPSGDLGNPDRTTWASLTRTYLQGPTGTGPSRNVVMWSWCGQVDGTQAEIQTYLDNMAQLEKDFPTVQFVYMTGHLNGGGQTGNVTQRNEQIRAYCRANDKILFDFADLDSHDPEGLTNYMPLFCNDNCDYSIGSASHNWANEWVTAHPSSELTSIAATICTDCCAHSRSLNCVLKGRAFWWLMARLAGWSGAAGSTYTISGTVTISGSSTGLEHVVLQGLPGNPTTNASGQYTATVTSGWSHTVTPTLTGHTFDPTHIDYSNVTSNHDQDYTATAVPTYTISGTILHNSAGLQYVVMRGLPGNPVTDSNGEYSVKVNEGWSNTVTPTLAGHNFSPTNRSYTAVTTDQSDQDYTATDQSIIEILGGGGGGCFIAATAYGSFMAFYMLLFLAGLMLIMMIGYFKRRPASMPYKAGPR